MAETTPTTVKPGSLAMTRLPQITLAETIAEARLCYVDSSSGQYRLGDCETSSDTADVVGFTSDGNTATNPDDIFTDGLVEFDAVLTADKAYYLGTDGKIQLESDLAVNDWIVFIGWARSTTLLDVSIKNFQKQKA